MPILVATDREVIVIDAERGTSVSAQGLAGRPACLAADALARSRGQVSVVITELLGELAGVLRESVS